LLTGTQYLQSVNDGRKLYYCGEFVEDAVNHPMLAAAFRNAADGYDKVYDAEAPHWFRMPHSVEELRTLLHDIAGWDDLTSVTLSGMMALVTAGARMSTKPEYAHYVERIQKYQQYCLENDLRCVEAITDAKGDRRLPPSKQDDPDLYLRIVERRSDGVVINGAKLHITAAAMAHELIVMPTKAMKLGEEDWAIACAVPLNAPGVTVVNTTYAPRGTDDDYWPVSSHHNSPEGFILFDNVFVPNDRVFLAGEIEHSATFAHSLGLWERLGGTAHMVSFADTLRKLVAHVFCQKSRSVKRKTQGDLIGRNFVFRFQTAHHLINAGRESRVEGDCQLGHGLFPQRSRPVFWTGLPGHWRTSYFLWPAHLCKSQPLVGSCHILPVAAFLSSNHNWRWR